MLSEIGRIVAIIIASLYGITAIYYFCAGMLFSFLLLNLGSLFCTKNIITPSASSNVESLGTELMPIVNPVLSASISGNRLKGFITTAIGMILAGVATFIFLNSVWGLIGVLAFSVLEVLLGIFFYLPRDKKTEPKGKSGISHILIHSVVGILIALSYWFK